MAFHGFWRKDRRHSGYIQGPVCCGPPVLSEQHLNGVLLQSPTPSLWALRDPGTFALGQLAQVIICIYSRDDWVNVGLSTVSARRLGPLFIFFCNYFPCQSYFWLNKN